MRTFALVDGDLVIGPGGYQTVTGVSKLKQDLSIALRETFGSDPYYPRWGSLLSTYVGRVVDDFLISDVRVEVERVVANYIALQASIINASATAGKKPAFSSGEVIRELRGVNVVASYDSVLVTINLETYDGEQIEVTQQFGA